MVPTVGGISKQNLCRLIYQHFGRAYITRLRQMTRKVLMKGIPKISLTCSNPVLSFF